MLIIQVIIWRKCVQQLPHFPARPVHYTLFYSMSSRDPPRNPQMRIKLHYILTTQFLTCVVEPSLWHASSYGCNMPLTIYYLLLQVRGQQVFDLCFCFSVKNQRANTWSLESHIGEAHFVPCTLQLPLFFIFLGIVHLPPLFSSATVAHPQA